MEVGWMMAIFTVTMVCVPQLDGRRSRQRSGITDTNGEEGVPGPPEWSRRMIKELEVIHTQGETVVLSCPATGIPKPEIAWYRDGVLLHRQPGSRKLSLPAGERMRLKNWNLKVLNAVPDQSGNYTCQITNGHGQISWTFRVVIRGETVKGPSQPVFVEMPMNQTGRAGRAVRISCRAHTDSQFQDLLGVTWLKHYSINGSNRDADGVPLVKVIEEERGKYAMPDHDVLILERPTISDSGWYTCMVDIEGYPHAVTHASMYIHIKPQKTTTTAPTTTTTTTENTATTEVRKRKKHRKKTRGRNKRPPAETESPTTTLESHTQDGEEFDESESGSSSTEVSFVENEDQNPEIGSSLDSESVGSVVRMDTFVMIGVVIGQFVYRVYSLPTH